MALLQKAQRRFFARHPLQLALAILGIAIGVGAAVSVDLAVGSARAAFRASMTALLGETTHHLVGAAGALDESLYPALRRDFPEIRMAPVVEGFVDAGEETFRLRGFDVFAERSEEGRRRDSGVLPVLPDLLLQQGTVLASALSARKAGVETGGVLSLAIAGVEQSVRVLGTIEGEAPADPALEGVLLADVATVQEIVNKVGVLDRIDLVLPGDADLEQRLKARLPAHVQLLSAQSRTRETGRLSSAFETNLQAMSLLGLLVGVFLIFNTMTFTVLQRRELLASLRLLGVTRREILREMLSEALVLGAVGGVLGVLAGTGAAGLLVDRVSQTINDVYYPLTAQHLTVAPSAVARGIVLGVLTAALGAWLPAREAAGVDPLRSSSRSTLEAGSRRWALRSALAGAVAIVLSPPLLLGPSPSLEGGIGGLFLLLTGCGLMIPALVAVLAVPFKHHGPCLFRMAVAGVSASLSRTGVAIAALAIAFAVALGVDVMTASFRITVDNWLRLLMQSDLYVAAGENERDVFESSLLGRARAVPGVAAVSAARRTFVESSLGQIELLALQPADPSRPAYRIKDGDADAVWSRFVADGAVLVSEPLASRHGLQAGDRLRIATVAGWVDFPIAGVVYDYRSDRGIVLMRRELYARYWSDETLTSLGLILAPGADRAAVREQVGRLFGDRQPLRIRSSEEIHEASLALFDRTFAVTGVLRLLAAAVALVGLTGSLFALHLERLREFATLRALGVTPGQLIGLVLLQSGYIGLCAGVIAVPFGILLAATLVRVIQWLSFGWTMDLSIPYAALWQTPAAACIAAVVTGIFPAWRAGRATPLSVLRDE